MVNAAEQVRVVDISDLVRLRKHLYASAWITGGISFLCLMAALQATEQPLPDLPLIGLVGVLAFTTCLMDVRGRVAAIPLLTIALVATATAVTTHILVVSYPVPRGPGHGLVFGAVFGGIAVATTYPYLLWVAHARFFRRARRSPYRELIYSSKRALGENYAGGALTWAQWVQQLRPWAVVVAVLTYVLAFVIVMLIDRRGDKNTRVRVKQVQKTVFAVGGALFVWTKRKSALRGVEKRAIDSRPPVLLLRSFDDDMLAVRKWTRYTADTDLHRKGMTFERVVEDHLCPFGPFIAIGRPDEPLSPLGAARDYVPDPVWRDEVEQRMLDASIIVLIIGDSEGLAWEFARMRDLGQLHKLILLFPPVDDVEVRWRTLLARDAASHNPMLPSIVQTPRTLAIIYADDLTPIVVQGKKRDEWSYETTIRIAGMLAITTGAEPAVAALST